MSHNTQRLKKLLDTLQQEGFTIITKDKCIRISHPSKKTVYTAHKSDKSYHYVRRFARRDS